MSAAQPLGWSCREVMQFPLSLSPGISGVNTSRLFLGDSPVSEGGEQRGLDHFIVKRTQKFLCFVSLVVGPSL